MQYDLGKRGLQGSPGCTRGLRNDRQPRTKDSDLKLFLGTLSGLAVYSPPTPGLTSLPSFDAEESKPKGEHQKKMDLQNTVLYFKL